MNEHITEDATPSMSKAKTTKGNVRLLPQKNESSRTDRKELSM